MGTGKLKQGEDKGRWGHLKDITSTVNASYSLYCISTNVLTPHEFSFKERKKDREKILQAEE